MIRPARIAFNSIVVIIGFIVIATKYDFQTANAILCIASGLIGLFGDLDD